MNKPVKRDFIWAEKPQNHNGHPEKKTIESTPNLEKSNPTRPNDVSKLTRDKYDERTRKREREKKNTKQVTSSFEDRAPRPCRVSFARRCRRRRRRRHVRFVVPVSLGFVKTFRFHRAWRSSHRWKKGRRGAHGGAITSSLGFYSLLLPQSSGNA